MPKLIIPTRNRPVSTTRVLHYLAEFYPGAEVVVADGSAAQYASAYAAAVAGCTDRLRLDYRRYGAQMSLADRLQDVLQNCADEFVIVGADDDFPVLDALVGAEPYLRRNPEYVLAIGAVVALTFTAQGNVRARLMHARTIAQDTPVERIADYARWPFPTSFALVRRTVLLERCRDLERNAAPYFGDFTMAFHDCLAGKILALEEIGYFRTVNEVHSKLRPQGALYYLDHAAEILGLKDHYRDLLLQQPGIERDRAEALAARFIGSRIGTKSAPPQNQPGFGRSNLFKETAVRQQYRAFRAMFRPRGKIRRRYLGRLRWVVDSMREVANCAIDNSGELKVYDSLAAMQGPDPTD